MTEASPAVLSVPRTDARRKAGSIGKPVLHVETRVVTGEGYDASTGEPGELWIKGPAVSPGYWNKPDLTQAAFHDGWLRTGDVMAIDHEGFYHVVDRLKDMYISDAHKRARRATKVEIRRSGTWSHVMALSIKDPETERLARVLASRTGETITVATRKALEDRLRRVGSDLRKAAMLEDLAASRRRWSGLPLHDDRSADEILGYDENGLPG